MERVVKSVSFNLDDPLERQLYEEASKGGLFSKNVKRMMAACLIPSLLPVRAQEPEEEDIDVDSFAFGEDD